MFDFEIYQIEGSYENAINAFYELPFSLPENMKEEVLYRSNFQDLSKNDDHKNFSLIKKNIKINSKILKAHLKYEFDKYCKDNGISYVPKSMKKDIENIIKDKLKEKNSYYVLDTMDFLFNKNTLLCSYNTTKLGKDFLRILSLNNCKIKEINNEIYKSWQSKFYEFLEFTKNDPTETNKIEKIVYSELDGKATLTNEFVKDFEYNESCQLVTLKMEFGKITLFSTTPFRCKITLSKNLDKNYYYIFWENVTNMILGV